VDGNAMQLDHNDEDDDDYNDDTSSANDDENRYDGAGAPPEEDDDKLYRNRLLHGIVHTNNDYGLCAFVLLPD
jgi:hypothetical protein